MVQNTHGIKTIGALPFFFQTKFRAGKLGTDGMCELYEQRARQLANEGKHAKAALKFSEGAKYASTPERKVSMHSQSGNAWVLAAKHYPEMVAGDKREDVQTLGHMADLLRKAEKEFNSAAANCQGEEKNLLVMQRMEGHALEASNNARFLDAGQNPFLHRR